MKGPKRPTTKLYRKDYIAILKYYNIAIYENTKLNVITNVVTTIVFFIIFTKKSNEEKYYLKGCVVFKKR